MGHYPYLPQYLDHPLDGAEVLEIGLGYGTLSGELMARGAGYHGLDIAEGPVEMVRHRLRLAGARTPRAGSSRARCSSFRSRPRGSTTSSRSAACTTRATCHAPCGRSSACSGPGGTAVVMLYNLHSYRRLVKVRLPELRNRRRSRDQVAAMYDTNAAGDAAPHSDYVSAGRSGACSPASAPCASTAATSTTCASSARERLLGTLDRLLGLDLYITARR